MEVQKQRTPMKLKVKSPPASPLLAFLLPAKANRPSRANALLREELVFQICVARPSLIRLRERGLSTGGWCGPGRIDRNGRLLTILVFLDYVSLNRLIIHSRSVSLEIIAFIIKGKVLLVNVLPEFPNSLRLPIQPTVLIECTPRPLQYAHRFKKGLKVFVTPLKMTIEFPIDEVVHPKICYVISIEELFEKLAEIDDRLVREPAYAAEE